MKGMVKGLLIVICLLLFTACEVETSVPAPTPTPTDPNPTDPNPSNPNPTNPNPGPTPIPGTNANNAAVLENGPLGAATAANSSLFKELGVALSVAHPSLRVAKAYATRSGTDTETLYWFALLVNDGTNRQCFVSINNFQFKDSSGATIVSDTVSYLTGSVAQSEGIYTDTCLEAGAASYVFGIELDDDTANIYSRTNSLTIASLEGSSRFSSITSKVTPQNYTTTGGASQQLDVAIKNTGSQTVFIGEFSNYLLLDEKSQPLNWGYFFERDWGGVLNAGQTQTLIDPYLFYDGKATKLHASVDFSETAGTLRLTELEELSADGLNKRLNQMRKQATTRQQTVLENALGR